MKFTKMMSARRVAVAGAAIASLALLAPACVTDHPGDDPNVEQAAPAASTVVTPQSEASDAVAPTSEAASADGVEANMYIDCKALLGPGYVWESCSCWPGWCRPIGLSPKNFCGC